MSAAPSKVQSIRRMSKEELEKRESSKAMSWALLCKEHQQLLSLPRIAGAGTDQSHSSSRGRLQPQRKRTATELKGRRLAWEEALDEKHI